MARAQPQSSPALDSKTIGAALRDARNTLGELRERLGAIRGTLLKGPEGSYPEKDEPVDMTEIARAIDALSQQCSTEAELIAEAL